MSSISEGFDETIPAIGELKRSNQFVSELSHLSTLQGEQINVIINLFTDIFRDTAGHTTLFR